MSGVMCSLVLLVVFAALAVLRARPLTLAGDCQFGLVQAWVSVISLIPFPLTCGSPAQVSSKFRDSGYHRTAGRESGSLMGVGQLLRFSRLYSTSSQPLTNQERAKV